MKRTSKLISAIIVYLVTGYLVIFGLYLISNPGYFESCPAYVAPYKCPSITGLAKDLAARPDFWLDVAVWPFKLITFLISKD